MYDDELALSDGPMPGFEPGTHAVSGRPRQAVATMWWPYAGDGRAGWAAAAPSPSPP